MKKKYSRQAGIGLIEVLVALTIIMVVMGALALVVLKSMKSAQFAKNQTQATKLAQEAMEKIRSIRDLDCPGQVRIGAEVTNFSQAGFSDAGSKFILSETICDTATVPQLVSDAVSLNQDLSNGFTREILIDGSEVQKNIKVTVKWNDSQGEHQSNLKTILNKKEVYAR